MTRNGPPDDPVDIAAQHVSWRRRCGVTLSEASAAIGAPVLPGGGWDEITWAYARAFRVLEKAPWEKAP